MKRLAIALLLVMLMLIPKIGTSRASWARVPLADRIEDAELVVLGELIGVKPEYFSITWNRHKYHPSLKNYTDVYDVGNIRIDKILKGSWHDGQVGFAFDHPEQPENPFSHRKVSFTEKQRGIWLLHRGTGGLFYVRRPDNFLTEDSLKDVQDALKAIRKRTGAVPKIIVQTRPKPHGGGYVAFLEGKDWTRSLGHYKHEAVGRLILSERKNPDLRLDLEVIEHEETVGQRGR
jgi:hypothetical protein